MSEVQSMEPHPHTPELFVAPDPSGQAEAWLQGFEVATHIKPVFVSHSTVFAPQMHVAEEVCGAKPPGWSHARAMTALFPKRYFPFTLHCLIAARQYSPLAHSVRSPQAQLSRFGDIPSVLLHVGTAYDWHRLLAALQYSPVPEVQSTEPHPQSLGFFVVPILSGQTA